MIVQKQVAHQNKKASTADFRLKLESLKLQKYVRSAISEQHGLLV